VDLLDGDQVGVQVVQALAQAREVLIGGGEVVQVPRDDAGAIPFKSRGRRAEPTPMRSRRRSPASQ
jgi:hypothetical protein